MGSLALDDTASLETDLAALSLEQQTPFRFFDLPSEIRVNIYKLVLFSPRVKKVIRKGQPRPYPFRRIHILFVSRRLHDEASHCLYSSQPFRIFPLQTFLQRPSIVELAPRYKFPVTTLQLSLGSSWTRPPASWTVNEELGLHLMERVHTLEIFVQCDPSHPVFEGFRVSGGFFTGFAGGLLRQVLRALPNLKWVQFDGNPSVDKDGELMTRLLSEARNTDTKILWGPLRGWKDEIRRDDNKPLDIKLHVNNIKICA